MPAAQDSTESPGPGFVKVGTLSELKAKGQIVVHGPHRPVLVIHDNGRVFALDNRCPHMGFPLDRASIRDGVLTCHWHHARFDIASGCTFDLWADDVPTCPVELRANHEIWISPVFGRPDPAAYWRGRLQDGLAHNIGLVVAKAIHALLACGVPPVDIIRQAALFGCANRDGWSAGLTILTALGNILPVLDEQDVYLALFHGLRRVAADCDGEAPRRNRLALASSPDPSVLKRWLQGWTAVRHRDAAERTLLTAIATGLPDCALADLMIAAGTERVFADDGHVLDFINKGFECLDLIGFAHAADLLPSLVPAITAARGADEAVAWRHPVDLAALCREEASALGNLFGTDAPRFWSDHADLAGALLEDAPLAIVERLKGATRAGASPADLGRALAYAAALRVARFGNANEHGDWETAHHVFTYANAVHQLLKRTDTRSAPSAGEAARALLDGAMAVYLARYLNVPPARLPGEAGDALDDLPGDADALRAALLDAFDRQRQVDAAARLVSRYLLLGHPSGALIASLGQALLREDVGFHACQMVEAGVRNSPNGATHPPAATSSLPSPAISPRIPRPSDRRCRRPRPRGA